LGYWRWTFGPGATFDGQAHAYGYLLDHLRIEQAAVVAPMQGDGTTTAREGKRAACAGDRTA